MKRSTMILALSLTALPLSACATDGYGYGGAAYAESYPYSGWYDGYYGSIYDGYWGGDGFFYYRPSATDRAYRRGDRVHFRNQAGDPRYNHIEGSFRPQRGYSMPHFNGGGHRRGGH
ncbi:hypothetical protein [Novosphingobium lentum]|uniref:hypothetical protein n=1 Tax=Novosphingobium lentum TaxID=145287 RepID=UPI0008343F54|nr:hypothetical protein [Novosphingobium lentum]